MAKKKHYIPKKKLSMNKSTKRKQRIAEIQKSITNDLESVSRLQERVIEAKQTLKELFKDNPDSLKQIEKQAVEFYQNNPEVCQRFLQSVVKGV